MAKNKLSDLRDHLFDALESLGDTEKPMDIDRAKAIADVARVVVDSAKVEVQFLQVTGGMKGSGFLLDGDVEQVPPARRLTAAK